MAPPGGTPRDNISHDMSNKDDFDTTASDDPYNSWNLGIRNPRFADVAGRDDSLSTGSPAIGAGVRGGNLGASEVARGIAKTWCSRSLR